MAQCLGLKFRYHRDSWKQYLSVTPVLRSCWPASLTWASGSKNLSQKIKWGFPKEDNPCWHPASPCMCMYTLMYSHTYAFTQPHEHVHTSYIQVKLEKKNNNTKAWGIRKACSRKSKPLSPWDARVFICVRKSKVSFVLCTIKATLKVKLILCLFHGSLS